MRPSTIGTRTTDARTAGPSSGTQAAGSRRLLIATSDITSLLDLRGPLIAEAIRRRHKVVILTPQPPANAAASLEQLGAVVVTCAFTATGINPFGAMRVRRDLAAQLATFAPETLAVCDAVATVALDGPAMKAGVPHRVGLFGGLSAVTGGTIDKGLQAAVARLTSIIVETHDERRAVAKALRQSHVVPDLVVIPSAGIDLTMHAIAPLPALGEGFTFVLVNAPQDQAARALFKAAAARVAGRAQAARFVDLTEGMGPTDTDRLLRTSHVAVHASSRDGLNRNLLLALAAGRPVITTDVAASRDTVDALVNGCIVPPGDADALAEAMLSVLKRSDLVPSMARASRLKAERRYELSAVNAATLDALGLPAGVAAAAA
jgi:hypothetical protein